MKSAEIKMSPETYIAAAWVKAGLIALLIIPALLIFPILAPVIVFLAVAVYFKEQKRADEIVQQRREEIEAELPRFVNTIEQELRASRDVLNIIHNDFDAIPITQNYILQFHKILYSHMNNPVAGRTKTVQNYISATYPDGHTEILFTPLSPFETPEALDKICEEYNRVIGNMELEPLIAIPIFIHDFLCIHPFNDGNGRMSRLLTTLLLYQNGFSVGKYISLEAKIAKNKDLYYDALAAYKDLDERVALVETKLPALEMVRRASENKIGRFNKQDIRELCPTLSDSSIESALRKLVSDGELKKEGKGKNTCYFRLK